MSEDEEITYQRKQKKNNYKFFMGNNVHRQVVISSCFDSGNIELVRQVNEFYYRLASVPDRGTQTSRKSWFHFRVRAYKNCKLKLVIENVPILQPVYESEIDCCKPVYRIGQDGQWKPLNESFLSLREQLQLHIDFTFHSDESVFFALTTPFNYQQNFIMLQNIEKDCNDKSNIYFKKEVLCYSINKMPIHLITLTEKEQAEVKQESKFDQNLFPENNRPLRFDKPVVLISSRVHPGEVASSHCVNGILSFLLSQDLRAYLLRRLFVFMIVPMLNPDGVFQGNYRMDTLNRNLNRYFTNPDFNKEPQVYGLKKLVQHLSSQNRLSFYFDMHGHSSTKPAFVYGNAFDDFVFQVQSQLFCKILSLNTRYFNYECCNFTEEQMTAKDRDEPLSKEGCSRVIFSRIANIPYCFTIEVGLHPLAKQQWQEHPISNPTLEFNGLSHVNFKHSTTIVDSCSEIGREAMISMLDILDKNPYSRIPNTACKELSTMKRVLATQMIQEIERFRRTDSKVYSKARNIEKMCQQYFLDKIHTKWYYMAQDQKFASYDWPIQGLKALGTIKQRVKSPRKEKSPLKKSKTDLQITEVKSPQAKSVQMSRVEPPATSSARLFYVQAGEASTLEMKVNNQQHLFLTKLKNPKERNIQSKQLQLPKILKQMIVSGNDAASSKRKTASNSPVKKRSKKNAQCHPILISKLDHSQYPQKLQEIQIRKKSMLQSLKKVQLQAEELFKNRNTLSVQQNSQAIGRLNGVRLMTQVLNDNSSTKASRRELLSTEPNIIQEMIHKETERFDKMLYGNRDMDQRMRNLRDSRRQLLSIKLRQLKKKMPNGRTGILPNIYRQEQEQKVFDDCIVRGIRELSEGHKDAMLYVSSKKMKAVKP